MYCWVAPSAPLRHNEESPHHSCPDRCEVVPLLGPYQLRGSFSRSCSGYCPSFWHEHLVRKKENPSREDEIHVWMHYEPCDWCFLYRTYIVLHLLDKTLAGRSTHPFCRPTDNGGWPLRWGQWMLGWFHQSMMNLSFPFVVCHRSMSGKYDPQFQLLQIETCTSKLIVKTTVKQEGNFKLTSREFVGHVYLALANSQAIIFRMSVRQCLLNL